VNAYVPRDLGRPFPRIVEMLREARSPAGGGVAFFSAIATKQTFRVRVLGFNPGGPSIVEVASPSGPIAVEVHVVTAQRESAFALNPLRPWMPMTFTPISMATIWSVLALLEGPPTMEAR